MSLFKPSYIQAADIVDQPIQHEWVEADEEMLIIGNSRLEQRICSISNRGILALSLGSLEWVVWRLSRYLPDSVPFQIVEAAWASIIDWRYLKWQEPPVDEWEDLPWSVGEPLTCAFNFLQEMLFEVEDEDGEPSNSSCLAELPLLLLNDPEPYKVWRRFVINRLSKTHPADPVNLLGAPVPREALDPACNYKLEGAHQLLAAYLQKLDPAENPYLCSPEEMIESGFENTPYSL